MTSQDLGHNSSGTMEECVSICQHSVGNRSVNSRELMTNAQLSASLHLEKY